MSVSKFVGWGIAFVTVTLGVWIVTAAAQLQTKEFEANEAVESIRVELTVGAGGEDLDEPIALDLGLGFPLWLHRLGRVDSAAAPFGAISQTGTDGHAVQAGQKATFEFNRNSTGLDELRTTSQLLAAVHISDISHIGFTSKADHGWILESYSIRINGKLFHENTSVNANGRGCQDSARERLMEINRESNPEQTELTDLRSLVAANLATDADRQRLGELEQSLGPLSEEVRRLERQLGGAAPFYSDAGFQSTWRGQGSIEKMKVIVTTAPHSAASTLNFVYFRTGGHKFLLGSAIRPLTPDVGPQEFTLELTNAPLTASDLRGFALGLLAPYQPLADTPDRWHPQRLRVEVDNRVMYDSEDNSVDRASLSAIRLIPPAHLNYAGQVVVNTPIAREAFVWEAGSGAGLDLLHGGADALPAVDAPSYPEPESVVVIDQEFDLSQQQEAWYDPVAEPFPGEIGFGSSWQPGWLPGGGWLPDWGSGWNDGWGPGYDHGPSWLDMFLFGLFNSHDHLPDGVIPDPVGTPPQLEHVNVDYVAQNIQWSVTGDESQIDHFVIDRVLIRPDLDVPIVEVLGTPHTVSAGQRSLPWSELEALMPTWTADEASRSYISYRVTMIPIDPALGVDPGLSAAAPARPMNPLSNFHIQDEFEYTPMGGLPQHLPLSAVGEPELPGPAAWRAGETITHNGIDIASLSPLQHHLVTRAQNNGDQSTVVVHGLLPPGHHRFIAYCGFVGAVEHHAAVQVSSVVHVQSIADPTLQMGFPAGVAHVEADPALPPTALAPVIHDINTALVGPGMMSFRATYTFHHNAIDPQHPPALVGLRLLGM